MRALLDRERQLGGDHRHADRLQRTRDVDSRHVGLRVAELGNRKPVRNAQFLQQALVRRGVGPIVDLQREPTPAARRDRDREQEQRGARLAAGVLPLEDAERHEQVVRARSPRRPFGLAVGSREAARRSWPRCTRRTRRLPRAGPSARRGQCPARSWLPGPDESRRAGRAEPCSATDPRTADPRAFRARPAGRAGRARSVLPAC